MREIATENRSMYHETWVKHCNPADATDFGA